MASTVGGNDGGDDALGSKWKELWNRHEEQWRRLDRLEERIDESAVRKRRRLANLLDETSTHRLSHLRLFVTHGVSSPTEAAMSTSSAATVPPTATTTKWRLVVEGRLLVGHLDHASAAQVEREAAEAAGVTTEQQEAQTTGVSLDPKVATPGLGGELGGLPPQHAGAAAGLGSTLPQTMQQQQQQVFVRSTDRTQYRGISEKEGDVPVEATKFTHFFDKMQVTFQTVHQPRATVRASTAAEKKAATPPSKKSRVKSKRKTEGKKISAAAAAAEQMRLLKSLTTETEPTTVVWNRNDTLDSHAFHVMYQGPPLPADKATHSVIATITLHPRPGPETRYVPSVALAKALFPQHLELMEHDDTGSGKKRKGTLSASSTKKKGRPDTPTTEGRRRPPQEKISTENDIMVQPSLTMKEIVSAIYLYVSERNFLDESDRSIIVNDKRLASLFDCERMNFFEVQERLKSQNLVTPLDKTNNSKDDEGNKKEQKPIVLTYIMTQDTATTTTSQQEGDFEDETSKNSNSSIMTFDTNIHVHGLFHSRVRELMRRIKRREFEYTSSRTRARNMLATSRLLAPQEDLIVKNKIEQAVCGRGYSVDHIPVWLALAKAAPPQSEARAAALSDAQTCMLLDRLRHHVDAAKIAWDVVRAIRQQKPGEKQEDQDASVARSNLDGEVDIDIE